MACTCFAPASPRSDSRPKTRYAPARDWPTWSAGSEPSRDATSGCVPSTTARNAGLFRNPEATAAAFTADGGRSGEAARMDAAGNVALTGCIEEA